MSLLHVDSDRGSVAPFVALLAVFAGLAALGLGRLGGEAVDAARARTAADAAALAGAGSGDDGEARSVAGANGGRLLSIERAGREVRVRVRVGTAEASARARAHASSAANGVDAVDGDVVGGRGGLAPGLRAALARAAQVLGRSVPVTSGYRSPGQQRRLWIGRGANPYPVAPPGSSMHERGLAVDVPASFADRLAEVGPRVGLCRPYPATDPVHFELC